MKTKRILFISIVLFQFIGSFSIIVRHEAILKEGKRFLFKTAPVDPYDAFRGRYVALSMEQETLKFDFKPEVEKFEHNQDVYAVIRKGEDGFAIVEDLLRDPPLNQDFLKVKFLWQWQNEKEGKQVRINMPFQRYYMNEKQAPKAETLYRTHSQQKKQDAHVAVRVLKGNAVIENLFIAGELAEDVVTINGGN